MQWRFQSAVPFFPGEARGCGSRHTSGEPVLWPGPEELRPEGDAACQNEVGTDRREAVTLVGRSAPLEQLVPAFRLRVTEAPSSSPTTFAAIGAIRPVCPLPDDPSRSRSQAARNGSHPRPSRSRFEVAGSDLVSSATLRTRLNHARQAIRGRLDSANSAPLCGHEMPLCERPPEAGNESRRLLLDREAHRNRLCISGP